ncbi:MAG: hypothetical protein PVI30_10475 [Myxococcales bacterium]
MSSSIPPPEDVSLREAEAFKPNRRPLLIAVLSNVLLAALCLGVPYYRGKLRAEDSLRAFSSFAACLLGGEPQATLGLVMPPGERTHYAARVLGAEPDWPARCDDQLQAVAPAEATFLWPSVKTASADVRAVVRLLQRELDALAEQRTSGAPARVPERPLLALARLRAGLTLLARAAGVQETLDEDALRFDTPADLVEPARLPIVAASTASLDLWMGPDGLEAISVDRRGISWLRLESGKVEQRRVRRTSLVRGTLRRGDQPYVVWAMPESRCGADEGRCVKHATGIARFEKGAARLPEPGWIGGHPASRFDRSLQVGAGEQIELLARSGEDGAVEVRRFDMPEPPAEGDKPRPGSARAQFSLITEAAPRDALLLPGLPRAALVAEPRGDGSAFRLHAYDDGRPPELVAELEGEGAWSAACRAGEVRWVVMGTDRALALARLAEDTIRALPAQTIALGDPLHPSDPDKDRVRLLCEPERATLVALDAEGALSSLHCTPGTCTRGADGPTGVAAFDAATLGEVVLVAHSGKQDPVIQVARLDPDGARLGSAAVRAACWDPSGGMCGAPTLLVDGKRVVLASRDRSDLLAIESVDGAESWRTLGGLKVGSAINTDVSAPMDQHRLRKGLDK